MLCRILLSMVKYFETMCSYIHKQLRILINARKITLRIPDGKIRDLFKTLLIT